MKDMNENWELVIALKCEAAFTGASMTEFTLQAHIKYASVQMRVQYVWTKSQALVLHLR